MHIFWSAEFMFYILVCYSNIHNLAFEEEVIKKRRKALKKEKELEHIQAKRNLDFLDILLFAKVSFFPFEKHTVLQN